MKVYLSHARKDGELALELAERLARGGFTVLHPEADIAPGDNWAKKIGKALQDSDFMVFLLTPGSLEADWVRKDVEFALGARKLDGRVFSVFVGSAPAAADEMPWILRNLPHRQVKSAKGFDEVAKEIEAQSSGVEPSSPNA